MKIQTAILMVALTTTVFAAPVFAQDAKTAATAPSAKDAPQDAEKLSPEKAKLYNDAMQKAMDDNKELRDKIHAAFEEADAIVGAEKFDKAAFLAKTAEIDQLYAKMRQRNNDAFISVVEKFSQEDRRILLKTRNEHRHRPQVPQ